MSQQTSGWYADPTGRHTYRYWDGSTWSNQVSDGGTAGVDPVGLDEATASTPPAPGTQAPGVQAATGGDSPSSSGVEVTQRSGGGLIGILGVLVGAVIVVIILLVLFNNAGDDDNTASTDAPAATVTTEEAPSTEAPATTAP